MGAVINPNNYKEHNLGTADGVAGFGGLMQQLPQATAKVNTVRVFQDGNYMFTHTDYNFFARKPTLADINSSEHKFSFNGIRLDELIFNVVADLSKVFPDFKLKFEMAC
ncbi:hypothetical protein SAMN05421821_10675 [Mucilaginibacter lappiensis]|uniref:Uncharacterized protein n=1 Tax=Mucilaginibacter lappiensis TaxID=354630 RepID=A0ABR6PKH4_9SPHI|nr:hypothetical protein [Mucilaginibacter lappiensis]MBB6110268.1 hypothetical protein [Mucilaginibacter lappiensis]SIR28520.1 hypothetical protein SAMN05421821_10675 [Mucilaginibacter lappiensis]